MRRTALVAALLTALAAGAAGSPAGAPATIFRIGETFRGTIHGSLSITFTRRSANGKVGQSCQDWFKATGSQTATMNSTAVEVLDFPGVTTLGGAGPTASARRRSHVVTAFSTEPGCPAVCAAARRRAPTPMSAHAADCLEADKRVDSTQSCTARAATSTIQLKGERKVNANVSVNPDFGSLPRCAAPPDGDAFSVHLFDRSDLKQIAKRGKFIAAEQRLREVPGCHLRQLDPRDLSLQADREGHAAPPVLTQASSHTLRARHADGGRL